MAHFTVDISHWVRKAKGNETLVLRKVALDLFSRVVLRSPVDTGRFRGNWQCALGSPPSGTTSHTGNPMSAISAKVGTAEAGDVVYLVNNLPYGPRLERGWSKQAPAGMVGITVAEFQSAVRRAAGSVK